VPVSVQTFLISIRNHSVCIHVHIFAQLIGRAERVSWQRSYILHLLSGVGKLNLHTELLPTTLAITDIVAGFIVHVCVRFRFGIVAPRADRKCTAFVYTTHLLLLKIIIFQRHSIGNDLLAGFDQLLACPLFLFAQIVVEDMILTINEVLQRVPKSTVCHIHNLLPPFGFVQRGGESTDQLVCSVPR
jgi:hypothetical protein